MDVYALRLKPGQDLQAELDAFVLERQLDAACVLTCVGSLQKAVLRFADQPQGAELNGKFEIVSLTGVLSRHGSHAHLSISDGQGSTYGGHLLSGCQVYTTAEIVLAALPGYHFLRTFDPQTGYPELDIRLQP